MLTVSPFSSLVTKPSEHGPSTANIRTGSADFASMVQTSPTAAIKDTRLTRIEQLAADLVAAGSRDLSLFDPLFAASDTADPKALADFLDQSTPQTRLWLQPLLDDGELTRSEILEQARDESVGAMRDVLTEFLERQDTPAVETLREIIARGRNALSPLFFEMQKLTEANEGVRAAANTFEIRANSGEGMTRAHDKAMAQTLRGWSAELTQKIGELREMLQEQTRRKVERQAR